MMDVRQRLGTLMIVTVCLFTTLFVRVAWLQTVQRSSLSQQAESNTKTRKFVPAPRGKILDRNGNVLVDNQVVSVVVLTKAKLPARVDARKALFIRLQDVLGIDSEELLRRFNSVDDLEGVEVARNVTESAVLYLGEHSDEFPGVSSELDSQRVYPQGKLAPHVLGYVSDIGDDLKSPPCNARYLTGDTIGKAGVERSYECVLRGMPGEVEYTVDRRNRIIPSETRWISQPIPGADVRLTIDPDLQLAVEKRVKQGLFAARQHSGEIFVGKTVAPTPFVAPAGSAVVLDSKTGALLAMASYPDYDPSEFVAGISSADYIRRYGSDTSNAPLTNRAISGQYAPGSTAKPFVGVSAFNNGLINERTTIEDTGSFKLDNCKPKNVKCEFFNAGKQPHGKVDLRRSLTVSSDVYYYKLGQRFWIEANWPRNGIQDTYVDFGFGGETLVGLPNEKTGRVPTPESLKDESGGSIQWRTGDNLNTAIGQGGFLATPLQIASAYGALASEGRLYYPRIAFDTPAPPVPGEEPNPLITTSSSVPLSSVVASTTSTSPTPPTSPTAPSTLVEARQALSGGGFGRFQAQPDDTDPATSVDGQIDGVAPSAKPTSSTVAPVDSLRSLPDGVTLTPRLHRTVDMSTDVSDPILAGLRGVVNDGDGTANPAFRGFPVAEFPVAGKTGTAQVWKKHDTALFVAFGGPENRYVVAVVLEQAGFGGQAAAPVARRIFEGIAGRDGGEVAYVTDGPQER
jgi:penicillin-binding protein 2